jgi:N-acyl-D-amino-acid deacylase
MPVRCELLIRGGTIVDGTGAPGWLGSIAISGDRIVGIGNAADFEADATIDVAGLAICPGFIDAHAHDDQLLFDDPAMTAKVSQGVTTVIIGNCGISLAPLTRNDVPAPLSEMAGFFRFPSFAAYFAALNDTPAAINSAALVGHTTLRVAVMDDHDRPASPAEAAAMHALCAEALAAGAIGLSSGLFYPPARAAPADEVAALVELVGAAGGIYTAHLRDEGDAIDAAIDEACAIAAHGNAPLIVSHHKVMGQVNFGRSGATLARIDAAARAQPVGFDVYPYVAGASMLSRAIAAVASRTIITWSAQRPDVAGRDLADVAAEMGVDEGAAIDALVPGGATYFIMDEADVRRIMAHPDAMIGSDGIANEHPHPRLWGTFSRVLGHYVSDVGLFGFEEAVRRMTSLPADRFGLAGRGRIAVGAFADLVVVDPATVADAATFADPKQPSRGIIAVYVNGRPVWTGAAATGERPGRVLRRAGMAGA